MLAPVLAMSRACDQTGTPRKPSWRTPRETLRVVLRRNPDRGPFIGRGGPGQAGSSEIRALGADHSPDPSVDPGLAYVDREGIERDDHGDDLSGTAARQGVRSLQSGAG